MGGKENMFLEYFRNVVKEVAIPHRKEEVTCISCIRQHTENLVRKVWNVALSKETYIKLFDVIPVGSMTEGSRLYEPDEFDFMMILDINSIRIQDLTLYKGCRPGYVKVFCDSSLYKPTDLFNDKQLHSGKIREYLLKYLLKTGSLAEEEGEMRQVKRDSSVLPEKYRTVFTAILGENEVDAWELQFEWKRQLKISVDTMPALKISSRQIQNLEKRGEIFRSSNLRDICIESGFLVPKGCEKTDDLGCGCWLVDFAPVEVKLIREMDENHKNCQKFLKYILKNYFKVPSYAIKTAVLDHILKCRTKPSRPTCALQILDYILKCLNEGYMPEPFLKNLNVFGWKTSDHFGPQSLGGTAVILEHHVRVIKLLFNKLQRMTKMQQSISVSIVDNCLPLRCFLVLVDDFFLNMEENLNKYIEQNVQCPESSLSELREKTKVYLSTFEWETISTHKEMVDDYVNEFPDLRPLTIE